MTSLEKMTLARDRTDPEGGGDVRGEESGERGVLMSGQIAKQREYV